MGLSEIREQVTTLYNEPEARPEMVKSVADKIGMEKVLGEKVIERVATWSTRAGIVSQFAEVKEVVTPYAEMDKKELVKEGAALVNEKIIQPVKEKATPYVAPHVEHVKEVVAPYIQKGVETKDAVFKDERVQKAVADLKDKFSAVRERPADVARELGAKAVDLIKYEKVTEYREYVCSEQFVSDTTKLVKEDLPQLAKDAAVKGQAAVQATATVLTAELDAAKTIVGGAWKKGYEENSPLGSWEALRGLASVLVAEIQVGVKGRFEENELDTKVAEVVARLKVVFGLGSEEPLAVEEKVAAADDDEVNGEEDAAEEEADEPEEPEEDTPTSM